MKTNETVSCPKCGGKGIIEAFDHIAQGVCFCCKGKGTIEVIDREIKVASLSASVREKAEWIMASTPESYEGLSYSKLYKIKEFACCGWNLKEAYPNLHSHFCEVGHSFFMAAQEEMLANSNF